MGPLKLRWMKQIIQLTKFKIHIASHPPGLYKLDQLSGEIELTEAELTRADSTDEEVP